ncbi:hypothetical protein EJ419_00585 [Alloscardovia theropitheci]|uniref:Uncharacterized protein n=1 Tax=Alloscardovia theropitheci TaxID=2496842 RepID=A0A4R0QU74_9BIFI|nr:hypothetical protein [Alloscardovia theropitheci]TCD54925.1 hypothetical protein EJ419_00585 [Alloscardovia theropitheci]
MALCILSSCAIAENTQSYTISPETEYVLVQSDLLSSQQGRISSFDKNGKEIQHANITFQDGGYIAVDKNRDFYVAGERGNDNVIFTRGKAQFFHQLDERDRSGATAIYLDETTSYASMNGTFSQEDGYYTLFVARDRKTNKTLYQTRIPLYAYSILEYHNDIYTLGDNQSAITNNAVVSILDKKTGKIKKTHHFKEYTGITDAYVYKNMLFVVVQRNYDPFEYEIMRWNEGNLVPLDETYISHADEGIKINVADDIIYGMEESRILP